MAGRERRKRQKKPGKTGRPWHPKPRPNAPALGGFLPLPL